MSDDIIEEETLLRVFTGTTRNVDGSGRAIWRLVEEKGSAENDNDDIRRIYACSYTMLSDGKEFTGRHYGWDKQPIEVLLYGFLAAIQSSIRKWQRKQK